MNKAECLNILRSMECGASSKEREAVEYVEKVFKREKKYKRWKRKYLKLTSGCDDCVNDYYGYANVCKYCSQNYINRYEKVGEGK